MFFLVTFLSLSDEVYNHPVSAQINSGTFLHFVSFAELDCLLSILLDWDFQFFTQVKASVTHQFNIRVTYGVCHSRRLVGSCPHG